VDRDLAAVQGEKVVERVEQPDCERISLFGGCGGQEDRKLVAAEPGREGARVTTALESRGDGDKKIVAGTVTEAVVDRLEVVQVEE
jgi:hypothetical protein